MEMKSLLLSLSLLVVATLGFSEDPWLELPAKEGGHGKKVVIITGDEEYRSEEAGPMLGKLLSQKHGFNVRVCFAIDPEHGYIDINNQNNIPGLEALAEADLMIISTRFRQLPDEQYAHLADYLNAGKPVIGLRTATHAFTGKGATGDFKWNQFGILILGERWAGHHGAHKREGARGVIEEENKDHPILNGVTDVFATSDVYGTRNLDQEAATILLRGAVTETLGEVQQNELLTFADAREGLIAKLGLGPFASMMDRFAEAERSINRAWSAASDGRVGPASHAPDLLAEAHASLQNAEAAIKETIAKAR